MCLKAQEVAQLREQTLGDNRAELVAAAALRRSFEAGGKLLASQRRLGHRGHGRRSAPAAATAGSDPLASRSAIDLTEDPAILTAIANDIGVAEVFQRQVIAYGRAGTRRWRCRRAATRSDCRGARGGLGAAA